MRLATATSGLETDPDGYQVYLDEARPPARSRRPRGSCCRT